MNKLHKIIMLVCGILIIINVFLGLIFDFKWSEIINSVIGLILVLFGYNFSSNRRQKWEILTATTIFEAIEYCKAF